ncbi:Arm DNA-binding domain-containing protein [Burkholderia stagnalis]|uniref:Arm DNA-binding domain-containing protein n=1 Tax=Burkholderia stagnalis TaxID=1503054 RepID=UPI002ED9E5DE
MPLTDVAVRAAKPRDKAYKLADGQGMYLEVMPSGSKYWRLKYRIDGKEKRMALGVYPAVTLLAARKARDEIKEQLRGGARSVTRKEAGQAAAKSQPGEFVRTGCPGMAREAEGGVVRTAWGADHETARARNLSIAWGPADRRDFGT